MGEYKLELVMDPVQLTFCTLNSGTRHWIFNGCQCWHLDTTPQNIWDGVESYAMHISWPVGWSLICSPKAKLVIFKQRISSSELPLLTVEHHSLFFVRLQCLMLRTLWIQNPAHVEQCVLQRPIFFLYQTIQSVVRAESAQARFFFGTKEFSHSTNF